MGLFSQKASISTQNAQIGELSDNGDIIWNTVEFDYAWGLFLNGALEIRGYRTINGIHYSLFYLPPAKAYREYEGQ
jgi:hypothetical protein